MPITVESITLPIDSTVASLIDRDNVWKDEETMQHFRPEDAKMILKIHLPRTPQADQIIWHYDKLGNYSVKSGYQIALRLKFPDSPCSSENSQTVWSVIWKLDLPEKVKIFIWRASKNFLLTVVNLWKKKIIQDPWCHRCGRQEELVNHAPFSCKKSIKMWRLTPFDKDAYDLASQDLLSGLHQLAGRRTKAEMELVVARC